MLERFASDIAHNHLLEPNCTYVVAVSGGLDSVVLHDMLTRLTADWGWNLVVAHVDHAQRPESFRDAAFVGALADTAGQSFRVHRLQTDQASSEASLRNARHTWLQSILDQVEGERIVTAHHTNDRLETAAWHAIRGADRHGLTSMQPRSGKVVRPLLGFTRGEILNYALHRKLQWREDQSNTNPTYTRNLIRHHMLSHAPQVDPYFHENLAGWLDHLEGVNTGLDRDLTQLLDQLGRKEDGGWNLYLAHLRALSGEVRVALIEHLARELNAGRGLTQRNLQSADKWLMTAGTGSYSEALPGLMMIRDYDRVSFVPRSHPVDMDFSSEAQALVENQPLTFGRFRLTLVPVADDQDDMDYITQGVYFVRSWEPGDRIKPVGMTGTKKVQDLFVDRKIARRDRLNWPLIVSSTNDIALIPGLARDRRYVSTHDIGARALQVEELRS